jgi:hypothetical protein
MTSNVPYASAQTLQRSFESAGLLRRKIVDVQTRFQGGFKVVRSNDSTEL